MPLPEYIDVDRAQKILGDLWTLNDVIKAITEKRLPAYAEFYHYTSSRYHDGKIRLNENNKESSGYSIFETFKSLIIVRIRNMTQALEAKSEHPKDYFIEYDPVDEDEGATYIGRDEIRLKPSDIKRLKSEGIEDDNKALPKVIVEQVAARLYKTFGKFPSYTDVLKELKHDANNNDQIGALVVKAGQSGVELTDGTTLATKTIQNWLALYKKTLPEFHR